MANDNEGLLYIELVVSENFGEASIIHFERQVRDEQNKKRRHPLRNQQPKNKSLEAEDFFQKRTFLRIKKVQKEKTFDK